MVVFIIGCVFHFCFSVLIRTVQSTFSPTLNHLPDAIRYCRHVGAKYCWLQSVVDGISFLPMDAWFGQCQTGLPRQHVSRASGLSVGLHWVEQIQSLGVERHHLWCGNNGCFCCFHFPHFEPNILRHCCSFFISISSSYECTRLLDNIS